jgi:hypothetical protein
MDIVNGVNGIRSNVQRQELPGAKALREAIEIRPAASDASSSGDASAAKTGQAAEQAVAAWAQSGDTVSLSGSSTAEAAKLRMESRVRRQLERLAQELDTDGASDTSSELVGMILANPEQATAAQANGSAANVLALFQ